LKKGHTFKQEKIMVDTVSDSYRVTGEELRQFVERFERLEIEKKDISDQQKEVMAEAKSRGYDTRIMRKIVSLRKRDLEDLAEEEAILSMYKTALGMN
jgi:uncharacterized protein (UPF0335 family)